MTYALGIRSKMNLIGVHPDLKKIVEYAISVSEVDFTVIEGRRGQARQKELLDSGKSTTLNSRHLTGHAVDIAPYVKGSIVWDLALCAKVAEAIRHASKEFGAPITWGGAWDIELQNISNYPYDAIFDYISRRNKLAKRAFIDAVHFELPWDAYPLDDLNKAPQRC